uniref:Uncharacterized protein n=1 Tax=Candidatus Kentrum sp. TUN TaxID=2126343 RepID=A0A451ANF5_9GAMM|nr:MAG: hypothetical protein BECKTUN1418F_GA0071002_11625 [Candidatus Kentron sp. TUN]VFK67581.1 MAG: hypothetical protein BECKTUN1418E_GA0071001_11565 [Candidatus Kentron sp. TUN]
MENKYKDCYCITFSITGHSKHAVSSFVIGIEKVLLGLDKLNKELVSPIRSEVDIVSYIEEIESGSIKVWLKDKLSSPTDGQIDAFVKAPISSTASALLKASRSSILRVLGQTKDKQNEEKPTLLLEAARKELGKYSSEYQDGKSFKIKIDDKVGCCLQSLI